jgi:hypothetical protein
MDGTEKHLISVGLGETGGRKKVSVVLAGVSVLFGPVSARTLAAQLVQWAEYIENHEPGPLIGEANTVPGSFAARASQV